MKRKVNHYTDEFKLKVVQEYLSTDKSVRDLKREYGFRGTGNIYKWMSKFGLKTLTEEQIKVQSLMSKQKKKSPREIELEAKVKKMEEDLELERLRTLALSKMIDIAERDLKISIRKKSGTKQ
jgi:transposase-like protein